MLETIEVTTDDLAGLSGHLGTDAVTADNRDPRHAHVNSPKHSGKPRPGYPSVPIIGRAVPSNGRYADANSPRTAANGHGG